MPYEAFIVDFTLNEEKQFKILELGPLETSNVKNTAINQYETFLRERLGEQVYTVRINKGDSFQYELTSLDPEHEALFSGLHGEVKHLGDQKLEAELRELLQGLAARKQVFGNKVRLSCLFNRDKEKHARLNLFFDWHQQKNTKSSLLITDVSGVFAEACYNKKTLHHFAEGNPLYPATYCGDIDGIDAKALASFMEKNEHTHYVLKPINASNGSGVLVLKKEEVCHYLKRIRSGNCADAFWRASHYEAFLSWDAQERKKQVSQRKTDTVLPFLLQACCPSKSLTLDDGRSYHPTGRLVVAVDDNNKLQILDAYWKLPAESISIKNDLSTETLVSRVSQQRDPNVVPISSEDLDVIKQQFYEHFPMLFQRIRTEELDIYKNYGKECFHASIVEQVSEIDFSGSLERICHFVKYFLRLDDQCDQQAAQFVFSLLGVSATWFSHDVQCPWDDFVTLLKRYFQQAITEKEFFRLIAEAEPDIPSVGDSVHGFLTAPSRQDGVVHTEAQGLQQHTL